MMIIIMYTLCTYLSVTLHFAQVQVISILMTTEAHKMSVMWRLGQILFVFHLFWLRLHSFKYLYF